MLETSWNMNLVETFFLCVNSEEIPMIYTYNPYTNRAPKRWREVTRATKESKGWTLFAQPHSSKNGCADMRFDRLKYLDGAAIKIAAVIPKRENVKQIVDYNETILPQLFSDMAHTATKLKYFLNSTLLVNIGSVRQVFDYVKNGSCDVALLLALQNPWMSYPVCYVPYHIVTNNRGLYSPLEKIGNFYGIVTLISFCILFPIIYIVILMSENERRWSFAGFEILRLLINAAIRTRINTSVLRIFFFTIFWYFLILHSTFQGNLVTFLMKDQFRFTAESLHDLRSTKYSEIYIKWTINFLIKDPVLRQKLSSVESTAVSEILGKESAACIDEEIKFADAAFEHNLIVSQRPVFILPNYHTFRDDWPLRDRFNVFLMWLESSGQSTEAWTRRGHAKRREKQNRSSAMSAKPDICPISMSMLNWISIFLSIGLAVAVLAFIFERNVSDINRRKRKNRRAARLKIAKYRQRKLKMRISRTS